MRRNNQSMSKTAQRGRKATPRAAAPKRTAATGKGAASHALTKEKQSALYDKAMGLFVGGDFAKAKEALESVAAGPNAEMAHAARMHAVSCERRLSAQSASLKTPEDQYNYAVSLINRGQATKAEEYLLTALDGLPNADHVHYALAISYGLQGKLEESAKHLEDAISLDAKNLAVARNDPDFESFSRAPEIAAILYPGGLGSG